MATIYADASGNILTFLRSGREEVEFPNAPSGTATTLSFDERTNRALIATMNMQWQGYSVSGIVTVSGGVSTSGGVLLNYGAPITLNPDSLARRDFLTLVSVWSALRQDTPLTAVQMRTVLRYILRRLFQDN